MSNWEQIQNNYVSIQDLYVKIKQLELRVLKLENEIEDHCTCYECQSIGDEDKLTDLGQQRADEMEGYNDR
jgi:hypothetical protein